MSFRLFIDGLLSLVSPRLTQAGSYPALSATLTTTALTAAACSGLHPAPDRRMRGAYPHLLHSFIPTSSSVCSWHTVIKNTELRASVKDLTAPASIDQINYFVSCFTHPWNVTSERRTVAPNTRSSSASTASAPYSRITARLNDFHAESRGRARVRNLDPVSARGG